MTTHQAEVKLRVAICGGGIGGLTLALTLARTRNIAVDVYEAAKDFAEIGAGISLRPRTLRFLGELGVLDEVLALNGRSEAGKKDEFGPALSHFMANKPDKEVISNQFGEGTVMLHRARFHAILFRHIPEHVGMHTGKRLVDYSDPQDPNSSIRLTFADGTEATCDILVGADGVRSTVRATMFKILARNTDDTLKADKLHEAILPRFSGAIMYRAVIPREKLAQVPPGLSVWNIGKLYAGREMFMGAYPIANGHLLNVVATTLDPSREGTVHAQPWVSVASTDELKPFLEGAAQEPRNILLALDGLELKKWVVNVVPPLDEWSSGRVTLLGDAAHAMTPFQGAGAGQAIEDSQVLSTLLAHPRATRATVQRVLSVYAGVRRPIAARFYFSSRSNGLIIGDPNLTLEECATEIEKSADAWHRDSPEDVAQRAVELFEASATHSP
ncbi:FAD/NAD(P)-binding domain-containing protein [Peniophora sp. CONT]|nr:FAD/NAD(P)-binding domain-containing protein [Peniophora sp. CONT]